MRFVAICAATAALAACASSVNETGTTGAGACGNEAQACSASSPCCAGLSCSAILSLCLSGQQTAGTTFTGATTTSVAATTARSSTGAAGTTSAAASSGGTTDSSFTAGTSSSGATTGAAASTAAAGTSASSTNSATSGVTATAATSGSSFGTTGIGATSTGSSTTGGSSGGSCALSAVGGSCATSVDCEAGLLCGAGTGKCAAPTAPATTCTPNGQTPTTVPCCETLSTTGGSSVCTAFQACSLSGDACTANSGCCSGLTCDPGSNTCVAACGGILASCASDADCCDQQGLTCVAASNLGVSSAGSLCYGLGLPSQAVPGSPGEEYYCTDAQLCEAFDGGPGIVECQLDATCDYGIVSDGGVDPCAVDGLVCDPIYNVCRAPSEFQGCVPGGPACQPLANSTVTPDCFSGVFTETLCAQSCSTTADCVDVDNTCYTSAHVCSADACSSTQFFGTCDSAGTNDGLCAPLGAFASSSFEGECLQAAAGGQGGPGTACSLNGNRQEGQLCDTADVCNTGICGAVCNAGTSGTPSCPAGQACISTVGFYETADAQDFGGCVTPCDFTQPDGGGCGLSSASVPTKCIPAEALNYGPATNTPIVDACGALAAHPIAVGQDCSAAPVSDALDPCVVGAFCYSPAIGTASTCHQLCEDDQLGQSGAAGGCQSGQTCTAINFTGIASTHTGACL